MYSLLFVSLAKPQYKMYCDLVAKTGKQLPKDFTEESEEEKDKPAEDEIDERKFFSPFIDWCKKFQSFLCCKRPKGDEQTVTLSKALMLDVINLPFMENDDEGTEAYNNKQIIDYEEALNRMKEHWKDTGLAIKDDAISVKNLVKRTIGKVNDSDEDEDDDHEGDIKQLIALDKEMEKEKCWYKKELIETPRRRLVR